MKAYSLMLDDSLVVTTPCVCDWPSRCVVPPISPTTANLGDRLPDTSTCQPLEKSFTGFVPPNDTALLIVAW
jgi:hypothetical protein